jgi:hypothetical protein
MKAQTPTLKIIDLVFTYNKNFSTTGYLDIVLYDLRFRPTKTDFFTGLLKTFPKYARRVEIVSYISPYYISVAMEHY